MSKLVKLPKTTTYAQKQVVIEENFIKVDDRIVCQSATEVYVDNTNEVISIQRGNAGIIANVQGTKTPL